MDRAGQLGYLLLNEEGAVLSSSGDLENDEKSAIVIMGLLSQLSQLDAQPGGTFEKLSITYDDHCYNICLSNRRVHVIKRSLPSDFSSA